MKYPFVVVAFSFALGILSRICFPIEIKMIIALFFLLLPFLWYLRGRKIFTILMGLLFILLGILHSDQALLRHRPAEVPQGKMTLIGQIVSVPQLKNSGKKERWSFLLEAESMRLNTTTWKQTSRLRERIQVFL